MNKRRRITYADKIIQNAIQVFCLLMFLQPKGYYSTPSNPILLYSTAGDIRIGNLSKPNKVTSIIKGLDQGSAVDFLYRKNLICWSEQSAELIQCTNFNGTSTWNKIRVVSQGLITPTGIAIDWFTDKIYWTDGETNRIEVISIYDKHRKVLFWSEVDLARAIAVVPMSGLMFWTDWGEIPKIERAGMNGDPETRKIIVKDRIYWPNGITVDYDKSLLYWVDAKLQFVDVIDFDGANRKTVVEEGLVYPFALTLFKEKLYWTDWKKWAIYTWDMSTDGPIKELIKSADPVPVDVRVLDASRQTDGDGPCRRGNGACSHLCLLSPHAPGYTCACPTGIALREGSNTTCHSGPRRLLLVAQRSAIARISLDSPDYTPQTIPLKDVKRAITVDFDPKTEFIYWADNIAKSISRARLDGSEQATVLRREIAGVPDSVAVDPLARNLYWTDPAADTISVARLDGTCVKVVIHEELYEPRAIAVHPTAGLMVWSDWGERRPCIERAHLDGTGRRLLVSERVAWPNGVALDTVNDKVYWGDAKTHKIEVCDMDGGGRRELHSADILHIFGLASLGGRLYWTDMQRRTLDSIDKVTGGSRVAVVEQMANMMGVAAVQLGAPPAIGRCADNGGCSHFCFNRPLDYVCACPLGLELTADNRTCVEPAAFLVYARKGSLGRLSVERAGQAAALPLPQLREVTAVAADAAGARLYWADGRARALSRCALDGARAERVVDFVGVVEGMAVEWAGGNLFWTDAASQRIEVARLDGSSRRALVWQGLKKPKSIVLDPRRGYMYWSDLGYKSIKRAAMDGASPTAVIEQAGRVNALAIDNERRAIYWAALDPPAIEYAHLDGSGRRKILSDGIPMPYAIALYDDRVFWGDWTTGDIESANKTDGGGRRVLHRRLDFIADLKLCRKARAGGGGQCAADNGGCAHLCLAAPDPPGYRCACPAHYKLNRDNVTCSEPEEYLLYAVRGAVGRLVAPAGGAGGAAGATGGECPDAPLPLSGLRAVRDIDYDPVHNHLYWMEEDSHVIRRVALVAGATAADGVVVASGIGKPGHMAFDVIGRTLYWTSADGDAINATRVDGGGGGGGGNGSAAVVVRGDGLAPRHLAVHYAERVLVWWDAGAGAVLRAAADGSARAQLAAAADVSALAVDQAAGAVYWAAPRQIHAVDLDGGNRRVVWQGGAAAALAAQRGLAAAAAGAVLRVAGPRAPALPLAHLPRVVALRAVAPVDTSHPCYGAACGAAAGACLARGACGCGAACACPAGAVRCARGGCVPAQWRCDGQRDCEDGSDEAPEECGSCASRGLLRCADGVCAATLSACAAGAACDHADMPDAFRCNSRLCLPPRLLCDGVRHCADGEDEAAAVCADAEQASGARHSNAFLACGAVGGVVAGALLLWAAARRWQVSARRRTARRAAANSHPLYPRKPADERARPLGASATESRTDSSLCERYPRPTANPPPSPATASGASPPPRRKPYRHYRASNRPPPPTPCSTDACESDNGAHRAPPPSPVPIDVLLYS